MKAPELNDVDVVVLKANSRVVVGPSMSGVGVLCKNDDRVDLNYSTGFLYPIGVPRSLVEHARLAGQLIQVRLGRVWVKQKRGQQVQRVRAV
jgi:hypothetical protein